MARLLPGEDGGLLDEPAFDVFGVEGEAYATAAEEAPVASQVSFSFY